MAALPAAFVAEALLRKTVSARGTVTAWKALGVRPLLDRLAAAGYVLDVFTSPSM